jgi:putative Ca2+/H+ antiporter (TMEM165/GDT1 family)
MQTFLVSTGVVALAEIGDKTQLLAFVLAARFRKPLPIIIGILVATVANHAIAGAAGTWLPSFFVPEVLRWLVGVSFIAMGCWALIPDKLELKDGKVSRLGVFSATLLAFFLVEIGDKTQLATVALAAQTQALFAVVAGTTLGMMLANVPAVLVGERLAKRLPFRPIRICAAALFVLLGLATLIGAGEGLGL